MAASLFRPSRSRFQRATTLSSGSKRKARTWTGQFVCLADKNASKVPSSSDKVNLQRSGLGKKSIQFYLTDSETTVHDKLMVEFENLSDAGGFELLRCQSNCRHLEKLECRWDVNSLKTNVGNQAKIYIRPIQKDLRLVPEEDSGNQIKEKCSFCNNAFPINNLRKHVELCIEDSLAKASNDATVIVSDSWDTAPHVDNQLPDLGFSTVAEVISEAGEVTVEVEPTARATDTAVTVTDSADTVTGTIAATVTAGTRVTDDDLPTTSGSLDGIWMQNVTDTGDMMAVTTIVMECASYCRLHNISSPVDILRVYQERIVTGRPLEIKEETRNTGIEGETNFIMVDRSNLIQTAFDEISALTVNDLRKCLEVQFYGETAVDYGGPRKEFFSLILQQLQKEYFDPLREWSKDYEVVGKIMALSTMQNGRLPRMMSEEVLQEVFVSESPRPFALELRKGLNSLGLVQLTMELPTFIHLFTPTQPVSLTLKMTTSLLVPTFSSEGSNRRQVETSAYSTFIKYVREAASGRRREVSLGSILKFATGTEEEPVLGFCIKPSIHFVEADTFLPTANTCVNRLNLTIPHGSLTVPSQDELFEIFDLAFCNTYFGLQ